MLFLPFLLACSRPVVHTVTIDVKSSKPISPYIYGVNSPNWAGSDFPYTVGRMGGNRMTAYNWETNASNAGNDYHNQNDGFMGQSNVAGQTLKEFLQMDEAHHAATIMTIPTAGYVSADKKGDGDVNKTPNYLDTRFIKSYAKKNAPFAYPPDTTDKAVYEDECVSWLESIRTNQDPLWFMLDNEPDLWGSTHSRIWPKNPTYAQIIDNNITFSKAIKDVAASALVFGPANYGWNGFHTFQNAPDANGRDFLNTYLDAMKDAASTAGFRLLDVLDVHWYPEAQGGGTRVTETGNAATAAARIQAPRSLWDPSYVEDSWIAKATNKKPIALIPTVLKQIDDHYPDTKFSISEYNFGGNTAISGVLAQADVLGIFGRYGVFSACNWGIEKKDTAEVAGFKAFINFDGKGNKFGDRSLTVAGEVPGEESVYASLAGLTHVMIVAINKTGVPRSEVFDLGGFAIGWVKTYSIVDKAGFLPVAGVGGFSGGKVSFTLPAMSVTTLDVAGAG